MRLLSVLAVGAAVLTFTAPPVSAGNPPLTVAAPTWQAKTPPTYRNPLQLSLPGGGVAPSCADPMVIHGQQPHDSSWYLYCTSDALDSTLGADGKPLIHNVPMFRSTDMTDWKYAGDAFPTKPSWVADAGGIWAPDVTYQNGEYHLYYAASDTKLPGGGSAVGVAISNGPTGPWVDSGQPVVAPQAAPNSTDRRWEYDPEVVTAGAHTYVYFGSYFGGIHARELSADGRQSLPATETAIAIDNRYEGTTIVKHDGWYYFMGSATNCCNGPLTGYSVFAARSRSPLGPFVDRDGRSILAGRVGGTPVITQNGNRWVGTGHNTVVTDFAGQDWTYYHAVDRNDPYYQGQVGYTKRPLLLDPLDWRSGWPVVRGDRGPSDQRVPGPVAQPSESATYRETVSPTVNPGRLLPKLSDNFNGSALSSRWTLIRPSATGSPTVAAGVLSWPTQQADLHPEDPKNAPLASVLTEPAPPGDYVVETKVAVSVPAEGCCQNYVQGGILIYQNDGNYVKLASSSIFNTRQTEFGKEVTPVPTGYPHYGNSVVGPVGDATYLRILHRRVGTTDRYTAYSSLDAKHWDRGGTWTANLGSHPQIGLVSMGGSGFTSTFDYIHVSTLGHACRH